MRAPARPALALLLALAAPGCVSVSRRSPDPASENRVTGEALVRTNATNVFDALELLRPQWLTSRGPVSVTNATPARANVYMNGSRLGDLDYLRQVNVIDVAELRFWPPAEASARFGMGNPRGVIEILARR